MMGPRQEAQAALFYEFSLEEHVPQDHLLRSIDRHLDLSSIRGHLVDFYSHKLRAAGVDVAYHEIHSDLGHYATTEEPEKWVPEAQAFLDGTLSQ